jgi:hypothetical protein
MCSNIWNNLKVDLKKLNIKTSITPKQIKALKSLFFFSASSSLDRLFLPRNRASIKKGNT